MISIFIINILITIMIVLTHSEILHFLSCITPKLKMAARYKICIMVIGIIISHIIGVWFFAFTYYLLIKYSSLGSLGGDFNNSLMDCAYFSFTTYTSLGIGDVVPIGHLRFLTGLETLIGLVIITWSASFLYIKMQEFRKIRIDGLTGS